MADKTVPVTYRKGKLRAGGLGNLATLTDGAADELPVMGVNGPQYTDLSSYLDNIFGSTRGAIIIRGASGWAKLDPGTSGFVLASNGAGADPSYQDKSGSIKFLSAQTASASSSLDFTSGIDSTYEFYEFFVENLVPSSDGAGYNLLYSTNGGSNWLSSNYITFNGSTDTAISLSASGISNSSGSGYSGRVTLFSPSNGTRQTWINFQAIYRASIAPNPATPITRGGTNATTAAVNAIRFVPSTGSFSTGTIRMYGIKGS